MPCHLLWSLWASCRPCGLWLIWPLLPQDPGSGAAPSAPASYSQASVESSGNALKGKCLSDVGPGIALSFPTLITSCLDSQFCFRNERLLLQFTFSMTQGQPFASASQKTWRLDEGPGMEKVQGSLEGQPAQAPAWGREGERSGGGRTFAPLLWVQSIRMSTAAAHGSTGSDNDHCTSSS